MANNKTKTARIIIIAAVCIALAAWYFYFRKSLKVTVSDWTKALASTAVAKVFWKGKSYEVKPGADQSKLPFAVAFTTSANNNMVVSLLSKDGKTNYKSKTLDISKKTIS